MVHGQMTVVIWAKAQLDRVIRRFRDRAPGTALRPIEVDYVLAHIA